MILNSDSMSSYGSIPLEEATARATEYIDTALELDPDNATALAARGLVAANLNQHEMAIEFLQRALEIDPGLTDASNWLWGQLFTAGRFQEALKTNLRIRQLDPLYLPTVANITYDYFILGNGAAIERHIDTASAQLSGISLHKPPSLSTSRVPAS